MGSPWDDNERPWEREQDEARRNAVTVREKIEARDAFDYNEKIRILADALDALIQEVRNG